MTWECKLCGIRHTDALLKSAVVMTENSGLIEYRCSNCYSKFITKDKEGNTIVKPKPTPRAGTPDFYGNSGTNRNQTLS